MKKIKTGPDGPRCRAHRIGEIKRTCRLTYVEDDTIQQDHQDRQGHPHQGGRHDQRKQCTKHDDPMPKPTSMHHDQIDNSDTADAITGNTKLYCEEPSQWTCGTVRGPAPDQRPEPKP